MIVKGLPQFGHLDFNHVCEECQFGKQIGYQLLEEKWQEDIL